MDLTQARNPAVVTETCVRNELHDRRYAPCVVGRPPDRDPGGVGWLSELCPRLSSPRRWSQDVESRELVLGL